MYTLAYYYTILIRASISIKNRAPAAIQVTAEQLLRDAQERQESQFRAPKQRVEDFEELHEYRGRKREEFEKRIRQTRSNMYVPLQSLRLSPSDTRAAKSGSNTRIGRQARVSMLARAPSSNVHWMWILGACNYGSATPRWSSKGGTCSTRATSSTARSPFSLA